MIELTKLESAILLIAKGHIPKEIEITRLDALCYYLMEDYYTKGYSNKELFYIHFDSIHNLLFKIYESKFVDIMKELIVSELNPERYSWDLHFIGQKMEHYERIFYTYTSKLAYCPVYEDGERLFHFRIESDELKEIIRKNYKKAGE